MDEDKRLLKLLEREETLIKKKEKIEEDLKKISKQIKELEHLQKVKTIEDTILVLDGHGINIKDIIKEIERGNFDHLKKQLENKETSTQETKAEMTS
ncbi:hypothetical protein [Paenibacillus gallinarum]|uniref:Uncharacterized protein n=1 Tax=Paenibacillus gallinarum TaxID=2762232 RepID=A0ABR8T5S6_9BACL|nr:hypothetical protein [Paenibacillus gallinarum]MBD7971110.1 hypothetical protein [Paenibacillus gallinarum]